MKHKTSKIMLMLSVVALLIALAFTFFYSYHQPAVSLENTLPPVKASVPAIGWGPGQVTAYGYTQDYNHLSKSWKSDSASIYVRSQGMFSPWHGFVLSSGHWQVKFRWYGKTPPSKTKYSVFLSTRSRTYVTGAANSRAVTMPPYITPMSHLGESMESYCGGDPTVAAVQRDTSGYYLLVATGPVFGEVRQTDYFRSWGGGVRTEVKFSQPE